MYNTGLISPDESDVEGDALITRPVSWRTDDVSEYFRLLDEHWKPTNKKISL